MPYVILLSGEECTAPRGLVEALRGAGVQYEPVVSSVEALARESVRVREERGTPPDAVLFDVPAGAELSELHAWASCASAAWPGVPLVACRPAKSGAGARAAQFFDESTLKRAGFHAIAVEAAQLSALLRDVEERGTDEDDAGAAPPDLAPASMLLPERLGVERLRATFEVVASLHFAADQRGAAQAALAGLAALVAADRWTIYLVGDAAPYGDAPYEPLAVRGLTESERRLPEGDWRRALLGDTLSLAGSESRAARAAAASADTARRKEGGRRTL